MSTFDESSHDRHGDGKFAPKAHAAVDADLTGDMTVPFASMFTINRDNDSVTMPAGTYILGDPCYSVTDDEQSDVDRWLEWLDEAREVRLSAFGDDHHHILVGYSQNRPVIGISTKYGDGSYVADDGTSLDVDSGMIGLVPVELTSDDARSNVDDPTITFDEPFECSYDHREGTITLGHIVVKTDPTPEYTCEMCGREIDFDGTCDDCMEEACGYCGDDMVDGTCPSCDEEATPMTDDDDADDED